MTVRRASIADLVACLHDVSEGGDPAALSTPDIEEALAALAPRLAYDVEAAGVVGAVRLWRFQTLPGAAADVELRLALDAFTTVGMADPESVPESLLPMVRAAISDPGRWFERARAVVRDTDDPEAHAYAARLLGRVAGEAGQAPDPDDPEFRPSTLNNEGVELMRRGDLAGAVELFREAWSSSPDDYPERASFARNLAVTLDRVFEGSQELEDLRAAIDAGGTAVLHTPRSHPSFRLLLGRLTELLSEWTARTGRIPGDDVVPLWEVLAAAGSESDDADESLMHLSSVLRDRYHRSGDLDDLHRAVLANERALELTIDPSLVDSRRFDLAVKLTIRYEYSGRSSDLDRGLDLLREVVAGTDPGHHNLRGRLSELGAAVHLHFERTGDPADLDEALGLAERALAAPGARLDAVLHDELAIMRRERYSLGRDPHDLDEAIAHGRIALRAAQPGERAHFARNLAVWLAERGDLDEALELLSTVDPSMPRGMQVIAMAGQIYVDRYEREGEPGDLDAGIEHLRRTHGSSSLATGARLARALCLRYNRSGDAADLAEALPLAQRAARSPAGSPGERLSAASLWARIAAALDDLTSLHAALSAQVAVLPEFAERRLPPARRRQRLRDIQGLTSDAAAVALRIGDAAAALRSLEDGRGILLAQALETHADFGALREAHPGLAERWDRLRAELDVEVDWAADDQTTSERRRRLVAAREGLVEQIRQQPGFERFLLPPELEELRSGPVGGVLVAVNTSRHGGDAILLGAGGITSLPLPLLKVETLAAQHEILRTAVEGRGWSSNAAVLGVLEWLWEAVVGPIAAQGLPDRVWWMPTGALAAMPLHAAGVQGGPNALDRFVSSYTPTARLLARARSLPQREGPGHALVVAMPHTPGHPPLPHAQTEAEVVARQPIRPSTLLVDASAGRAAVLDLLARCDLLHFAGHASSDPANPVASALALHDGPLDIASLLPLHLTGAELAYLSACSTAHGGGDLADESLHICSALQVVGFRHAIGTLWPIADDIAARAADRFYPLWAGGRPPAEAIRVAAQEIRADYPASPLLWAAHLHVGP